jgi:DSHCT (NUC185) domain
VYISKTCTALQTVVPQHYVYITCYDVLLCLLYDVNTVYSLQVRNGWKTEQKYRQPAWDDFMAITRVLQRYGALEYVRQQTYTDSDTDSDATVSATTSALDELLDEDNSSNMQLRPTQFGDLVGGINSDNELWLALVLTSTAVKALTDTELAGLIPAITSEYTR